MKIKINGGTLRRGNTLKSLNRDTLNNIIDCTDYYQYRKCIAIIPDHIVSDFIKNCFDVRDAIDINIAVRQNRNIPIHFTKKGFMYTMHIEV